MVNGGVITSNGKNLMWSRQYTNTNTIASTFSIGTGTNTPTSADTALQTPILTGIAFLGGFPIFDTANNKVTTEGYISPAQGNGNILSEVGEFNTDGTPVMLSRDVFTGVTKTSSIELIIIWTHQII